MEEFFDIFKRFLERIKIRYLIVISVLNFILGIKIFKFNKAKELDDTFLYFLADLFIALFFMGLCVLIPRFLDREKIKTIKLTNCTLYLKQDRNSIVIFGHSRGSTEFFSIDKNNVNFNKAVELKVTNIRNIKIKYFKNSDEVVSIEAYE